MPVMALLEDWTEECVLVREDGRSGWYARVNKRWREIRLCLRSCASLRHTSWRRRREHLLYRDLWHRNRGRGCQPWTIVQTQSCKVDTDIVEINWGCFGSLHWHSSHSGGSKDLPVPSPDWPNYLYTPAKSKFS